MLVYLFVLFCFNLYWSIVDPGFPGSSAGKESSCNAGEPSLTPGSGRSPEGTGYSLQYSWASLVAQMVKNLPTMRETWVQSLGWEDPTCQGATKKSPMKGIVSLLTEAEDIKNRWQEYTEELQKRPS